MWQCIFSTAKGVLTSLVLYFFTYGTFHTNSMGNGMDVTDLQSVGTIVATSLIIIVNLKVRIRFISSCIEGRM